MKIIWLFQKEPAVISQNVNISSSQYIISTIKLIKVDYTLHKAKRLMIVDSEWMNRDHEQAKKNKLHWSKSINIHLFSTMCQIRSEEDHLWPSKLKNTPCTTDIRIENLCARHIYKRVRWCWWWFKPYWYQRSDQRRSQYREAAACMMIVKCHRYSLI
jgi:hypothetical protein